MTDSRIFDFFRDKLMKITAFFLVAISGAIFLPQLEVVLKVPRLQNKNSSPRIKRSCIAGSGKLGNCLR